MPRTTRPAAVTGAGGGIATVDVGRGDAMSRNRWKARVLAGMAVLTALSGCKQQLFLDPGDYHDAVKYSLPKSLETDPHEAITPPVVNPIGNGPANVLDPTRPARPLTLKECIAIALEQGNTGNQSLFQGQFGTADESLPTFDSFGRTDTIRSIALAPATEAANIERSLARFDTRWITSMSWQKVDQPVAAQFLSFQQQRDSANITSQLVKPLPTGGLAGITFSTDYSKFTSLSTQPGFVNPNYTPRVTFGFEQPLLQMFGVEINQIADSHPSAILGSQLFPGVRQSGGQLGPRTGILLTRIRFDQSRAEYQRSVNFLLINVEAAYWNLYASYYNLYAQEQGLLQSYYGYWFQKTRVDAGTDPPQQENQARAQFEQFRAQVYRARGQVLESERQLRILMGLRSDDGFRLVPIDEPNIAPYKPDYYEAANETIANRPELLIARQELKKQQLNLVLTKNLRRPDLRSYASYDVAGLGTRLDGPELTGPNGTTQGNALTSFGNNQFNSWTIGLRMDIPLGFRDANGLVRQSQLDLTRLYYILRSAELKTLEYLTVKYRRVIETNTVISPLRQRRIELSIYVERAKDVIRIGRWQASDLFNLLQVQRDLAQSISDESRAIADYNTALAELEFAKGTIMRYNNVTLAEGPLPPYVQKRAIDHERERNQAAIKLRERPADAALGAGAVGSHTVGPAVGTPFSGDLPPFAQPLQEIPQLPTPRPADPKGGMPMGPAPDLKPLPDMKPMPKGGPPAAAPVPTPAPAPAPTGSSSAAAPAVQPWTSPATQPVPTPGANLPQPEVIFTPAGSVSAQPRGPIVPVPAADNRFPPLPEVPPRVPSLPSVPAVGIPPSLPEIGSGAPAVSTTVPVP